VAVRSDSPPPSWYEPPTERWGVCPECGVSQEDCEHMPDDTWQCPNGHTFTEEQAHYDPRDDEPPDFDERRDERDY